MTQSSGEQTAAEASPRVSRGDTNRLVVRNTLYLTISQAVTVPLSMLVNVVMARYLGPDAFGLSYLAATLCSFGFLVVSWGHNGVLPAVVARTPSRSGLMLGSSLAFRGVVTIPVYAVLALGSYIAGYGTEFQWVLLLTTATQLFTALAAGGKDTIRGLERTDISAYAHVGQQLLIAAYVIPVVMLGGQLLSAMAASAAACATILIYLGLALKPAGVAKLRFSWPATKELFRGGTPFVVGGLVMNLQPMLDAMFLAELAPTDAVGWYAVARRLVGVLLFPATAFIGALYPTLCRLHTTDRQSFTETSSGALRAVCLLVVPVALGCVLYADFAISMFSREAFGPAADDLRILSLFVALVYFSMPLGTCVVAADKQRAWSLVQSICLVVSVALDPLLIPWTQERWNNGGLGVCLASTVSEVAVVACGVILAPRGVFDKRFLKTLALAIVAGAAMVLVARVTAPLTPFVSGPLALTAYALTLWRTGAFEPEQIEGLRRAISRRLGNFRRTPRQ